jgi:hypothetical protein
MTPKIKFGILAASTAFALAAPIAASAQDWDRGYDYQGGSGYGSYDNTYAARHEAWVRHERWERYQQHERAEARQRYWHQRQWQSRYYGHRLERDEDD